MSGILFVISAPSGAGKTSLVKALMAATPGLALSVSYTTRAPRPSEIDGVDYRFVSLEVFHDMAQRGEFLEMAQIYDRWYGTGKQAIIDGLATSDVVLEIDWQGARQVRDIAADAVVTIFVLPPSMAELERRLRARGQDDAETIAQRLAGAYSEIERASDYQYTIVNQDFDEAARDLQAIVRAARLSSERQDAYRRRLVESAESE